MSIEEQPTLRERQAERVARDIRLAFIRLVNDKGPNGFSLRDVATEAGVSERTLYRYYPSRDELIQGIQANENAAMEEQLATLRTRIAEMDDPESVAKVFEVFEDHADLVKAAGLLRLSGNDQHASASRTETVRRIVAERFDLDDEAVRQMVGLIRALSSSAGWMRMTDPDVGLDSREAGFAAQWALQILFDAVRNESGPLRPTGGQDERS